MQRPLLAALLSLLLVAAASPALARGRGRDRRSDEVSPARRIEPRLDRNRRRREPPRPEWRSIDGSGNHLADVEQNAAGTPLARVAPADYADGASSPAGPDRPSARAVSNAVSTQGDLVPNPYGTSDFLWQWGQFVDHDIDLTEGVDPPEAMPIPVPTGDTWFDPGAAGGAVILFNRSIYDPGTGNAPGNPREQFNEISGWIDASNVYGSDEARARALRANDGTGRLATGPGNLLPDSAGTLPNATGGSSQVMFLAGDVRANEQVGLTALHTLFMREHNRLADEIRADDPGLDGDVVYERARALVGALVQRITYEEFLPALLGRDALDPYRGYDPDADARLLNEFSTAAYRFGHSALSANLLRLDARLQEVPEGHLPLRDAFFSPDRLRDEGGIEPVLRGLAAQLHQSIDVRVVDDVRNFLFGPPGAGGFDLAALNVQRGRDHGLASYNDTREAWGMARAADFADITRDPEVQARLAAAYDSVDDVDVWVGGLAEDPVRRSQLGPLFHEIVADQFTQLRAGDRFFYEVALSRQDLERVRGTRLADVIRRNTTIGRDLQDDVFRVGAGDGGRDRRPGRRR